MLCEKDSVAHKEEEEEKIKSRVFSYLGNKAKNKCIIFLNNKMFMFQVPRFHSYNFFFEHLIFISVFVL